MIDDKTLAHNYKMNYTLQELWGFIYCKIKQILVTTTTSDQTEYKKKCNHACKLFFNIYVLKIFLKTTVAKFMFITKAEIKQMFNISIFHWIAVNCDFFSLKMHIYTFQAHYNLFKSLTPGSLGFSFLHIITTNITSLK